MPVGNGLTGRSLMENSSKKQQKNTSTSDSNSTPNKKKKRGLPQRKRVQLAYMLLAVIAVSLLILLMMIPRVKEAERQKLGGDNTVQEGEHTRQAPGGTESEQQISELPEEGGQQPEDTYAPEGQQEEQTEKEIEGRPGDTQKMIPPDSVTPEERGEGKYEDQYKDQGEEDIEALHPLGDIEPPPRGKGKLYLVIDDVGYNLEQLKTYLNLPIPITFALLPGLEYSQAAQSQIARNGEEMILHQPIEPIGDQDPGPGALYVGMDPEEMRTVVNENLSRLSEVIGVNNHMGSKGTSDPELMEALFSVLKGRHLFFLDSRTTARTVAERVAEEIGLPFSERNVFLDNIEDQIEIEKALSTALEISRSQGYAVMIGHVWSEELASTLALWYGEIEEHGYEFARLSSFFTEEHVHAGDGN